MDLISPKTNVDNYGNLIIHFSAKIKLKTSTDMDKAGWPPITQSVVNFVQNYFLSQENYNELALLILEMVNMVVMWWRRGKARPTYWRP